MDDSCYVKHLRSCRAMLVGKINMHWSWNKWDKSSLWVTFPKVKAKMKLENVQRNIPQLTQKQKVLNSYPLEFGVLKRFWKYILDRESLVEEKLWASISKNSLNFVASLLKHCSFRVTGRKGQFKDEFVTAGGIPLSEISLNTMESKIHSHL